MKRGGREDILIGISLIRREISTSKSGSRSPERRRDSFKIDPWCRPRIEYRSVASLKERDLRLESINREQV